MTYRLIVMRIVAERGPIPYAEVLEATEEKLGRANPKAVSRALQKLCHREFVGYSREGEMGSGHRYLYFVTDRGRRWLNG